MIEKSLVIIKPDALSKKVSGEIIAVLEKNNLLLRACKMVFLGPDMAEKFYAEHRGKEFYEPLVKFMSSNPVIVTVWEGEGAIGRIREIIGSTDPIQAKAGTIRRKYATDNRHNAVHGSDSLKSAKREIAFFFEDKEIFSWQERIYKK